MTRTEAVVAGAGGFIGHHLGTHLKEQGYWVGLIDLKPPNYEPTAAGEFEAMGLKRMHNCVRAANGMDEVDALAADIGGMGVNSASHSLNLSNNSLVNLHTMEAVRTHSTKMYLLFYCVCPEQLQLETAAIPLEDEDAYPAAPRDAYGWEKLITERLCEHDRRDHGIETRIVRSHDIFGPEGTWDGGREKVPATPCRKLVLAKLTANHEIEILGDGELTRSFCCIDDSFREIYALMRSDDSEPLNLGQDRLASISELADSLAEASIWKKHVPDRRGSAAGIRTTRESARSSAGKSRSPLRRDCAVPVPGSSRSRGRRLSSSP